MRVLVTDKRQGHYGQEGIGYKSSMGIPGSAWRVEQYPVYRVTFDDGKTLGYFAHEIKILEEANA